MQKISLLIIGFTCSLTGYADNLLLSSVGFASNTLFPVMYACDGKNSSPPLNWINVPPETKSLSLIVSDASTSEPIYHWVVFNISPAVSSLDEGVTQLPPGAKEGKNSWHKTEYYGLCPPKGTIHVYNFTLYALNKKLTTSQVEAGELLSEMQGSVLQKSTVTVSYSRWGWPE